jgi:pimeloyl-ACP methyl ester carboxylesterase
MSYRRADRRKSSGDASEQQYEQTPRSVARLASLAAAQRWPLPQLDTDRPPWPGEYRLVDGVDLFIRHTPSSAAGPEPALYIHGLGGASTNFTDLAHLLSPFFDGYAVDLPGFGHSGPPLRDDYSIRAHARTIVACLDSMQLGRVHLVGNSMGGAIASEVAARRPDLLRSLTLISPAVPDLRPHGRDVVLMPILMIPGLGRAVLHRLDHTPAEQRARDVIAVCFAHPDRVPPNRLDEAVTDIIERRSVDWAHDALVSSLRGLVRTYIATGSRSPWRHMSAIAVPTVVVWGELDRLVDVSNAPKVAAVIPDAELLVLPDVGHTAQLEDPIVTARAILALSERANAAGRSLDVGA